MARLQRMAKSQQRPDQFQFLKSQKISYPLENKYEKFQFNWCISEKFIQKTQCVVTFQTPCTILHRVILARVNFRHRFQECIDLIPTIQETNR
jgi:hypothetical protein